ncbi:MAG TPA: FAD:protein FMN transferase, partial [Anaerolineales bacterium]|nr:FAD:protein FMN transferase [Anaerolineales bacterium]
MDYDKFPSMNTEIVLAAEGPGAAQAFAEARGFIGECEARFTRFSTTSELMQLNRSAGEWFAASADLYDVVRQAFELTRATQGLFDPAIYDDMLALGYDRSFPDLPPRGGAPQPARSVRRSLLDVALDPEARGIRLPPGVRIDLGGVAKGWIAEQAARRMLGLVDACAVNAGGDLFLRGRPADGGPWRVGLEDPRGEGGL